MTRAFVVGATGYTGRHVVGELCARSVETIAHVRPDSLRLAEWQSTFGGLGASVDTTPFVEAAMSETLQRLQPDLVFALLGTTRARARAAKLSSGTADSYESVDYGLTMLVLRARARSPKKPRFVYLSATGVGPSARSAYMAVRFRAEQAVKNSGLSYLIARPSFITGSDRDEARPGERLLATLSDAALSVAGAFGARRVRHRLHSMSGAELARGLVAAALGAGESRTLEAEDLRNAAIKAKGD